MGEIAHLRSDHFGSRRAGEEQEMVGLVRADVGQDAAVALARKRIPGRPGVRVQPMRPQPNGLQHAADGARRNQLARLDHGPVAQSLAEVDAVDAPGLALNAARVAQHIQRSKGGLVTDDVLAGAHRANPQGSAFVGNCRRGDQLDGRVLQNFGFAGQPSGVWNALQIGRGQIVLGRIEADQFATSVPQQLGHFVDVVVVHTDHAKAHRRG